MKNIYWRPQSTPVFAFILMALFSVTGIVAVEHFRVEGRRPHYEKKIEASRLALEAMELLRDERLRQGIAIDSSVDPADSGLIGSFVTPVTSDPGNLESKQTSVNPNFAGLIVDLLEQAGVKEGDPVAVSFSGSFPALNIAVLAALKTLGLDPTIISSASGSQWGANNPDFLWIDMEHFLYKQGTFPFRSSVASMGGKNDQGREMTQKGREYILKAINRNGLTLLKSKTLKQNIDERMAVYFRKSAPKVFINVGGGIVSAGIRPFKVLLKPGLLPPDHPVDAKVDSVINRFLKEKIPVIHLGNIRQLATHYGFPIAPTSIPKVGEGSIYLQTEYNPWLAGGVLLGIVVGLYVFSRSDWGFRILQASSKREEIGPPEPMV
ncbi:MAG: hypothetical protein A4E57_03522 [Syntrophorhabdaceae bacterium PtaU1.Bin034]|nr:MAG: hypothetical protein A4E57_03522 [Syntrophorhabdaceae bacterium PtaU1.Bin034]